MSAAALAGGLAMVTALAARHAVRARVRSAVLGRLGTRPAVRTAWQRGPAVLPAPRWLAARLAEAAIPVAPTTAWTGWSVAGAVVVTTALVSAGPGAAVLAAAVAVAGPVGAWRLLRHRGAARFEHALPGAVEALAAGLRSGASLRQALCEAAGATPGPLGADLARVAAAVQRGAGVVEALEAWAERRPQGGVRLVVAALCLGAEAGGPTAQAVDNVALTLRHRLNAEAEARSLATQARASAAVLAAAPLAFCAVSAVTDRRAAAFLLDSAPGLVVLTAGLVLDALGALWMAAITRAAGASETGW